MGRIPRLLLVVAAGLAVGCGNEPPYIHDMMYSPNAGLVGLQESISGTVQYSDPDNDISQVVIELYAPDGSQISASPPLPIQNTGQGVVGSVSFSIDMWTPAVAGLHHIQIWIIDLVGHQSNKLQGVVRVS